MLWLLACENEDPAAGKIDLEHKVISYRLRRSEKTLEKYLNELEISGFIACNESVTKPYPIRNETVTPETETETEARINSLGVDQLLFDEFLEIRKRLKANNSPRAVNTLLSRIEKFVKQESP